ncbi:MAG: V-type ATP synthase subunit D [Acidobacteria bacterium RIFCSPLOWO2_02_FULL_68_18]|nr:MAG: V-type ATP synthase subunit D [Acidobacteria bacterium RIFCSPLOWO2_02_FULL_68_18]OFW48697.1 MAG: V-type ATP synthase subunit D [Acidobacteria bacterium RIFCSPLOWO2_12_FULL_68_19]
MERVPSTRMGLLVTRGRRQVALQGAELLRSKREALASEFVRLTRGVIAGRAQLAARLREATRALTLARALQGEETLASLALAAVRRIPLAIEPRTVWGVPSPEVKGPQLVRAIDARGTSPVGWGLAAAEAARRHEEAAETLIAISAEELRLKRLGEEIRKASRKINALEQVLIPELEQEITRVEVALEEREREGIGRLKRFKARREGGSS